MSERVRYVFHLSVITNKTLQQAEEDIYKCLSVLPDTDYFEIDMLNDPVNTRDDESPLRGLFEVFKKYADLIWEEADKHNLTRLLNPGVTTIKEGIADALACLRCDDMIRDTMPKFEMKTFTKDTIKDAPMEIIHAVAHKMGLAQDKCEGMDKDMLLEWIHGKIAMHTN